MSGAPVTLTIENGLAMVALGLPPKNIMNHAFFDALDDAVSSALNTPNIAGIVMHGRGRHFSCGADLPELAQRFSDPPVARLFLRRNLALFETIAQSPVPVVAAISGCCLGAGLELALTCRRRIAAPRAVFSLPESTFGIIPGCGGTVRLPRLIGRAAAVEMILSGRTMESSEALSLGLIDHIVPRESLLAAAAAWCHRDSVQ
jgi:enoyl-CoA hydratase/carnithine racemase